jgi:hypothetical protein
MTEWAQDFYEIQDAVGASPELREDIIEIVDSKPIHGQAFEGDDRKESFRDILKRFFAGNIDLEKSYRAVSSELPRRESRHASNNQVFPSGWEERLIRIQASRFYNQAVLMNLIEQGEEECFVPHSANEDHDTACTLNLAGGPANTQVLLERLERKYNEANYHNEPLVPNHPHCTHTIVPTE